MPIRLETKNFLVFYPVTTERRARDAFARDCLLSQWSLLHASRSRNLTFIG
jgi:hypothetical protein